MPLASARCRPMYTVAIHSQVDGKLQEVLFTEGQRVKKGDVLAKIDPRLFQAALDQAKAKKAQDEAQLIAAEKDLVRSKTLAQNDYGSQQTGRPEPGQGRSAQGLDRRRRRRDRNRADPARLHLHHGAQRRARRHPARRPWKHRACLRPARHRQPGADAALRGDVHAAVAGALRRARGAWRAARCRSSPSTRRTARR